MQLSDKNWLLTKWNPRIMLFLQVCTGTQTKIPKFLDTKTVPYTDKEELWAKDS